MAKGGGFAWKCEVLPVFPYTHRASNNRGCLLLYRFKRPLRQLDVISCVCVCVCTYAQLSEKNIHTYYIQTLYIQSVSVILTKVPFLLWCCFVYQYSEKMKTNILDNLNNTNGTIIGVTCCIVLILLIISVIVQIKQPRKKYMVRREDFDPTMFQEVFEPPHYELCTVRSAAAASADLVDLAEDFENYHALRRASSRCIHDHHCGSFSNLGNAHITQLSLSGRGSRGNLSARDAAGATLLTDLPQPPMAVRPMLPSSGNRRSILVMKHSYSQEAADNGCDLDDDLEEVPTTSHQLSRHEKAVQRSVFIDFWWGKSSNRRVNYGDIWNVCGILRPTYIYVFLLF